MWMWMQDQETDIIIGRLDINKNQWASERTSVAVPIEYNGTLLPSPGPRGRAPKSTRIKSTRG